MNTSKLTKREIAGYGVGDMGFNFYWTNIATFLLIFYTDVFGISAAAAATMLFTVKLANAVTDPLIGALADRTQTRWGKFRPYMLFMAVPLAITGVLTYSSPDLGDTGKLVWAYATYLLLMTFYTAVNLPYNALSGVLSVAAVRVGPPDRMPVVRRGPQADRGRELSASGRERGEWLTAA